jgi:hypothetical protein
MSKATFWAVLMAVVLLGTRQTLSQQSAGDAKQPNVSIDFVGFLPGTQDRGFSGQVEVDFAIYLTPTGGRPVWSEHHTVIVVKGQIAIKLGLKTPVPWTLSIANFKFVSARVAGGTEILPRMPVVNVVYSASKTLSLPTGSYSKRTVPEKASREGAMWAEALAVAKKEGKRLPTYLEWYSAAAAGTIDDFADHYEWTLPWVYDTASQGQLNAYFRGRFQGCDYMDLDPTMNKYAYRLCISE